MKVVVGGHGEGVSGATGSDAVASGLNEVSGEPLVAATSRARANRAYLAARLDSPRAACLLTFGIAFLVVALRLALHGGNPSAFAKPGEWFTDPDTSVLGLAIRVAAGPGYDGQFYYRLALYPFTTEVTSDGVTLDAPAYRQQRIVYPFLAWLLSLGGNVVLVPFALIAVNLLAFAAIGWMGGILARRAEQHALWGLTISLYPGFFVALAFDTTETVATSLLLLGIVLAGRPAASTAALSLAVLARETTLLGGLAVGLAHSSRMKLAKASRYRFWLFLTLPLVVYLVWQFTLFVVWGTAPVVAGGYNVLLVPFFGISYAFLAYLQRVFGVTGAPAVAPFNLVPLAYLAIVAILVLRGLRGSRAETAVKIGWLLYLMLAVFAGPAIFEHSYSYFRVLTEFYILGAIVLLGRPTLGRSRFYFYSFPILCGMLLLAVAD